MSLSRNFLRRGAAVAVILALGTSSCVRIRVHRTSDAQPPIASVNREAAPKAVFGFADLTGPIALNQRCADGWETLTTEETTTDFILRVLTLNLYAPWTVTIACSKPAPPPKDEWLNN